MAPECDPDRRSDEHRDDETEGDANERRRDVDPQLAGLRLAHHRLDDGQRAGQVAARRDERRNLPDGDKHRQRAQRPADTAHLDAFRRRLNYLQHGKASGRTVCRRR